MRVKGNQREILQFFSFSLQTKKKIAKDKDSEKKKDKKEIVTELKSKNERDKGRNK